MLLVGALVFGSTLVALSVPDEDSPREVDVIAEVIQPQAADDIWSYHDANAIYQDKFQYEVYKASVIRFKTLLSLL